MQAKYSPYDPFSTGNFSNDVCFLCGALLNEKNRTVEHVFPQWLIRHFHLNRSNSKNASVDIDGQENAGINYSKILIPCCRKCNSEVLAPIERRVKNNLIVKRDEEYDLTDKELFWWTAKVYYGLYLRDHLDGRFNLIGNPDTQNKYIRFRTIFLFLQSTRFPFLFKGNVFFRYTGAFTSGFPVSALIFNVKLPRDASRQFDFKDDWIHECIYFRIGKKGILISFDGGYLLYHGGHLFKNYIDKLLHPKQMEELAAMFFHMAELRTNIFQFYKRFEEDKTVLDYDYIDSYSLTLPPLNWRPIFTRYPFYTARDFDENEFTNRYVFLLSYFTRVEEDVVLQNGLVHTWLRGSGSDDFLDIDVDKYPDG